MDASSYRRRGKTWKRLSGPRCSNPARDDCKTGSMSANNLFCALLQGTINIVLALETILQFRVIQIATHTGATNVPVLSALHHTFCCVPSNQQPAKLQLLPKYRPCPFAHSSFSDLFYELIRATYRVRLQTKSRLLRTRFPQTPVNPTSCKSCIHSIRSRRIVSTSSQIFWFVRLFLPIAVGCPACHIQKAFLEIRQNFRHFTRPQEPSMKRQRTRPKKL